LPKFSYKYQRSNYLYGDKNQAKKEAEAILAEKEAN